jgi:N6-adenosine-specific RNA methylase IME4
MKFDLIYCDPPWTYNDKCHAGQRGAGYKYPCMNAAQLEDLPVRNIVSDDCLLAMWWVNPMPDEAMDLVISWGFALKTMAGFTWVKRTKNGTRQFGKGNWTRANTESVLFAVRGKPKRVDAGVSQLVECIHGAHSAKPVEVRLRLERLMGPVRRLEMFARDTAPGWTSVGHGVDGRDICEALEELAVKQENGNP